MGDFLEMLPEPYRGPDNMPHSQPGFFGAFFIGTHMALGMTMMPGRVLGVEARPRRWSRDYVMACCDEAARKRQALRGETPTTFFLGKPILTNHSWEKMFHQHLHWKRWTLERMGPRYKPT